MKEDGCPHRMGFGARAFVSAARLAGFILSARVGAFERRPRECGPPVSVPRWKRLFPCPGACGMEDTEDPCPGLLERAVHDARALAGDS